MSLEKLSLSLLLCPLLEPGLDADDELDELLLLDDT